MTDLIKQDNNEQLIKPSNSDILHKWYVYLTGTAQATENTYVTYKTQVSKLDNWNQQLHPDKNLFELTRANIRDYIEYILDIGGARNSISLNIKAIRSFYIWALDEEEVINRNPVPTKIRLRGKAPKRWSPTAKQVLQMRNFVSSYTKISHKDKDTFHITWLGKACLTEVLICTGIRLGEAEQLRVDNINFNTIVFDQELATRSPYVGAAIYIDAYNIGTKHYKEKTVYLSKLAANLLKMYIRVGNLHDSAPLFPWSRRSLQNWITYLGNAIVIQNNTGERRNRFFTDISPQAMAQMPPVLRKKIIAKQRKSLSATALEERARMMFTQKKQQMRVHAFRNFNAAMMYHRGWNGSRHDIAYVRDLLGHSSDTQSLEYITRSTSFDSDRDWRQVVVGTSKAYWPLFFHFRETN